MGTGPAGRVNFTVWVVTRRSGYSYEIMKHHSCIYILGFRNSGLDLKNRGGFTRTVSKNVAFLKLDFF